MKKDTKQSNKPLYFVIAALILLFICVSTIIHNYNYATSKAGALGDAFNGLSAPFIGILSAFLIFYSFREQIAANKMQFDANKMLESQWMFDTYLKLLNDLQREYDKIEVRYTPMDYNPENQIKKTGREAFGLIFTKDHHWFTE